MCTNCDSVDTAIESNNPELLKLFIKGDFEKIREKFPGVEFDDNFDGDDIWAHLCRNVTISGYDFLTMKRAVFDILIDEDILSVDSAKEVWKGILEDHDMDKELVLIKYPHLIDIADDDDDQSMDTESISACTIWPK
jgi:hypothetical protein